MAILFTSQMLRPTIRHFSANRPRPNTKTSRFVTMSCLVSGVVLPFAYPALESSREKSLGYPHQQRYRQHPPLCFHAR